MTPPSNGKIMLSIILEPEYTSFMENWITLVGAALGGALFMFFYLDRKNSKDRQILKSDLQVNVEKLNAAEMRNQEFKMELGRDRERLELTLKELSQVQVRFEKEKELAEQRLHDFEGAQAKLSDTFKALAADTLKASNTSFIELAHSTMAKFHETAKGDLEKRQISITNLVKPVHDSLNKFDTRIQEIEKARIGAYEGISEQVKNLLDVHGKLQSETQNLVKALSNPRVRGRWGEIQLKRVVELAGMLEHCDFEEQKTVQSSDDKQLRPDLVVNLPLGKSIVVDSKAPLSSYLAAMETAKEEDKLPHLKHHARLVKNHISDLGKKAYWSQFEQAPEFVVMFIPADSFYNAALEQDPDIIEYALKNNVVIATPSTLIAILKAVSYGWRQEKLAANAQEISNLGKILYKRIYDMSSHFSGVGKNLTRAVESYNKTLASLETRVLVSARKFSELSGQDSGDEINIEPVDSIARIGQRPDLLDGETL